MLSILSGNRMGKWTKLDIWDCDKRKTPFCGYIGIIPFVLYFLY